MKEHGIELFIVGPTAPDAVASAVEYLALPGDITLDAWAVDGQLLLFCHDPALAGGLARAIAIVVEGHASLMEGTMTNRDSGAEAAITRHAMNGEGETIATDTVTLTYTQQLDDPQGVLEFEMMNLFEFQHELQPVDFTRVS